MCWDFGVERTAGRNGGSREGAWWEKVGGEEKGERSSVGRWVAEWSGAGNQVSVFHGCDSDDCVVTVSVSEVCATQ